MKTGRAELNAALPDIPIIEVRNLVKRFGQLMAVDHCNLKVETGTITGLIGPNGAGKSTLFDLIAGALPPDGGSVFFSGREITRVPAHQLFEHGLVRTFQIAQEFSQLTTLENLMMVPQQQIGERLVPACWRPKQVQDQEAEIRARAEDVLDFLHLAKVKNELAADLSGGQKKLLELGRTMMAEPKLILLDEIAAGVNRTLLQELMTHITRLNREYNYSFFMVEHDMEVVETLCDPVIVLARGKVMAEGRFADIQCDPLVIEAYFGGDRVELTKFVPDVEAGDHAQD